MKGIKNLNILLTFQRLHFYFFLLNPRTKFPLIFWFTSSHLLIISSTINSNFFFPSFYLLLGIWRGICFTWQQQQVYISVKRCQTVYLTTSIIKYLQSVQVLHLITYTNRSRTVEKRKKERERRKKERKQGREEMKDWKEKKNVN